MLLGIQLIIVLSLAVVLAVVFVALLCDFLKGNNEQLQQRNVELRVRQDERDRMGLSQPLAWLQGLAALARPDMAEAFASSMGLAPEREKSPREAARPAAEAQRPAAEAAASAATAPARADVAAEPELPSTMTARHRYDEMKATTRATSWASKEELEQLAGRAARIRARHEASQQAPDIAEQGKPATPLTAVPFVAASGGLAGRLAEITSIRDYAPVPEPFGEPEPVAPEAPTLDSTIVETAEQPQFGDESEWEFSIEGEEDPEGSASVDEPVVSFAVAEAPIAEFDEAAAAAELHETEEPAAESTEAESESPEAESTEPDADVSGAAIEVAATTEPSLWLSNDEVAEEKISDEVPADLWRFVPVTSESSAVSQDTVEGTGEQTSEIESELELELEIEGESESPTTEQEQAAPPVTSEVIARGAVETDFWNPANDEWRQPEREDRDSVFESPAADAVVSEQEPIETTAGLTATAAGQDEGSFQDIASEILSGYVERTPASRPVEAVTESAAEPESGSDSFRFDLDEELNRAADAAASASQPEANAEWSWSQDESGSAAFELPPVRRDEMDVAALFASTGVNVELPSTAAAASSETARAADEQDPLSEAAAPAPKRSVPEHQERVVEQTGVAVPAGLHAAETLAQLIESQSEFRGVAVAVGINDYESLKDKLAASSASDSLAALNRMIVSMLGPQDFAARFTEDEFILLYPGEIGSAAQRRLFQVSEKLWDFQLRSLGSLSIMFSWGGLEVGGESFADSVTAARERMYQTRRSRKNSQLEVGITRRRVVNG